MQQRRFHHQLIQEYYAAEELLELLERSPKMSDRTLQLQYLNYLKWTEPVALMLGLLDDLTEAERVVRSALEVDLMLGARLAGEVKVEFQERAVQVLEGIEEVHDLLQIELLRKMQLEAGIPRLLIALENGDFDVRWNASEALGALGSEKAIPGLTNALRNQNFDVRWNAAKALGELGSEKAIPGLSAALEDQNFDVYSMAAHALRHIKSQSIEPFFPENVEEQNYWEDESISNDYLGEELSSPLYLIRIWRLYRVTGDGNLKNAIDSIQSRCKYYNHDLYLSHQATRSIRSIEQANANAQSETTTAAPNPTEHVTMIFNAPVHGVAGIVAGDQNTHPDSPR